MMSYILKSISYPKKGQVTVYIFSVMVSLIVAAFIVINIGKTAKDKTHADNAADAGALAACSVMAQGFNYVADQNGNDTDEKSGTKNNQARHKDEIGRQGETQPEQPNASKGPSGSATKNANDVVTLDNDVQGTKSSPADMPKAQESKRELKNMEDTHRSAMESLEAPQQGYQDVMQKKLDDAKNKMGGQQQKDQQNNYYDTAISQGYKVCFQNAGVHHRLGKLSSKMYEQFQKTLEPGMVQSGEPRTFFWVDGAGRAHVVTCIIDTEGTDNWTMNDSQDNKAQTKAKSEEFKGKLKSAQGHNGEEIGNDAAGIADPIFDPTVHNPAGDGSSGAKKGQTESAADTERQRTDGLQRQKKMPTDNSKQQETENINSVDNIVHSQTVRAMNFQFHMGSPVKSIIGDIDVMTFYPPVQSSAIASFNYTGRGKIHNDGGEDTGSSPNFECGLIAAF